MRISVLLFPSVIFDLDLVFLSFLQKEKDSLRKELQALKKENKLLKENNALANRKKEHYVCEIKRLNKVPEQLKQGESP